MWEAARRWQETQTTLPAEEVKIEEEADHDSQMDQSWNPVTNLEADQRYQQNLVAAERSCPFEVAPVLLYFEAVQEMMDKIASVTEGALLDGGEWEEGHLVGQSKLVADEAVYLPLLVMSWAPSPSVPKEELHALLCLHYYSVSRHEILHQLLQC